MAYIDEDGTQIKLISELYVKPKYKIEAAEKPYFLGPVELRFLHFDQMQRGLLFDTKPNNMQSFISNLSESLSISLVDFYPLAGQISMEKDPNEDDCWVYVDCNKGPGARIIHAIAVSVAVKDILSSTDVHKAVQSLFDLGVKAVNYDGRHRPLLSIQVTELADGVFLGFTMNHSLADGTSLWHFISTLSEIYHQLIEKQGDYNNIVISRKPIFVPNFPDGCGRVLKLPYINVEKPIARSNEVVLRERIFHLSSKSISLLKTKANEECGVQNISTFQALSAFIWRSIMRARNLQADTDTCFVFVINTRPLFNPPISDNYFGNFVMRQQSLCKVGELLGHDFGWAAMRVHEAVMGQNDKTVREFYEMIVKLISNKAPQYGGEEMTSPFNNDPNLVMIGGSTRFDMYGPEFGLGKAEAVLAGYSSKTDGKITLSPGRDDIGSVDLEVCLKPETMDALELEDDFMSLVLV